MKALMKKEIKAVPGTLSIEVYVNCPYCDEFINLLDASETNGFDHNEDSAILKQACPEGVWADAHEAFEVNEVKCTSCHGVFNVKELIW